MCYDVSYLTRKAERYARHHGTAADWEAIKKRLPQAYHASGFDEPPCTLSIPLFSFVFLFTSSKGNAVAYTVV